MENGAIQSEILKIPDNAIDITAALVKFQGGMTNPKTTSANLFFKSRYADLAEILNTIRKPLFENGLAIIQGANCADSQNDSIAVTVETILLHVSGQRISYTLRIVADKKLAGAQAIGSAITYGRRYSMTALLGLAQEDDDANAASGNGNGYREPEKMLTGDEVLKALENFYQDPKSTEAQVSEYINARRSLLKKLPENAQAEVRVAYDQLMARFDTPKTGITEEKKPDVGAPKKDWKASLDFTNSLIQAMSQVKHPEDLSKIMNSQYMTNKPNIDPTHVDIIEKTYLAIAEKLRKEGK